MLSEKISREFKSGGISITSIDSLRQCRNPYYHSNKSECWFMVIVLLLSVYPYSYLDITQDEICKTFLRIA